MATIFEEFVLQPSLTPNITLVEIPTSTVVSLTNAQIVTIRAQLALREYQIANSVSTIPGSPTDDQSALWEQGRQALVNVYVAYENATRVVEYASDLVEMASDSTKAAALKIVVDSAFSAVELACTALYNVAKQFVDDPTVDPAPGDMEALTTTLETAINGMATALETLTQAADGTDNWLVLKEKFGIAS